MRPRVRTMLNSNRAARRTGEVPARCLHVLVRRVLPFVAAFAMAVMLCACNTLDHSADAITIQGEWQVVGTNMTFVITDNQIRMPEDVNYDYTIDVNNQTIAFNVGNVSGSADYTLGTDKDTGLTTLSLTELLDGQETTTKFVKLSDSTTATPSATGGNSAFANPSDS